MIRYVTSRSSISSDQLLSYQEVHRLSISSSEYYSIHLLTERRPMYSQTMQWATMSPIIRSCDCWLKTTFCL